MMRSKRGAYIMEAAIVLPIMILAVITIILVVMFFFQISFSQSEMHMALRCESGRLAGDTVYYSDSGGEVLSPEAIWDGYISSEGGRIYKNIRGKKVIRMIHRGILSNLGSVETAGRCHVTRGPEHVLRCQMIKKK